MNPRQAELEWYRRHGRHPERIVRDSEGDPYVIGDWSWNQGNRPREVVETEMQRHRAGDHHAVD